MFVWHGSLRYVVSYLTHMTSWPSVSKLYKLTVTCVFAYTPAQGNVLFPSMQYRQIHFLRVNDYVCTLSGSLLAMAKFFTNKSGYSFISINIPSWGVLSPV